MPPKKDKKENLWTKRSQMTRNTKRDARGEGKGRKRKAKEMEDGDDDQLTAITLFKKIKPTKAQVESKLAFEKEIQQMLTKADDEIAQIVSEGDGANNIDDVIRQNLVGHEKHSSDLNFSIDQLNKDIDKVAQTFKSLLSTSAAAKDLWTVIPDTVMVRAEEIKVLENETKEELDKSFRLQVRKVKRLEDARILWRSVRQGLQI